MGVQLSFSLIIRLIIALVIIALFSIAYARVSGDVKDTGGGWFDMIKERFSIFGVSSSPVRLEDFTIKEITSDGYVVVDLKILRPAGHIITILADGEAVQSYLVGEDDDQRVYEELDFRIPISSEWGLTSNIKVTVTREEGKGADTILVDETIEYIRSSLPDASLMSYIGEIKNVPDNRFFEENKEAIRRVHNLCEISYQYCCSDGRKCIEHASPCKPENIDFLGGSALREDRYHLLLGGCDVAIMPISNRYTHFSSCLPTFINRLRTFLNSGNCKYAREAVTYTDTVYVMRPSDRHITISIQEFMLVGIEGNDLVFSVKVNTPPQYQQVRLSTGGEMQDLVRYSENLFSIDNYRISIPPLDYSGSIAVEIFARLEDPTYSSVGTREIHYIRPDYANLEEYSDVANIDGTFKTGSRVGQKYPNNINAFFMNNRNLFVLLHGACDSAGNSCCSNSFEACEEYMYPCRRAISNIATTNNYLYHFVNSGCEGYVENPDSETTVTDQYVFCAYQFIERFRDNIQQCRLRNDVLYTRNFYVWGVPHSPELAQEPPEYVPFEPPEPVVAPTEVVVEEFQIADITSAGNIILKTRLTNAQDYQIYIRGPVGMNEESAPIESWTLFRLENQHTGSDTGEFVNEGYEASLPNQYYGLAYIFLVSEDEENERRALTRQPVYFLRRNSYLIREALMLDSLNEVEDNPDPIVFYENYWRNNNPSIDNLEQLCRHTLRFYCSDVFDTSCHGLGPCISMDDSEDLFIIDGHLNYGHLYAYVNGGGCTGFEHSGSGNTQSDKYAYCFYKFVEELIGDFDNEENLQPDVHSSQVIYIKW